MLLKSPPAWPAVSRGLPRARLVCPSRPPTLRLRRLRAAAALSEPPTFAGRYGKWTLTDNDRAEVLAYRAALNLLAFSFDAAAAAALLGDETTQQQVLNVASVGGVVGLGAALFLVRSAKRRGARTELLSHLVQVHMYVTPIKRFMQALWLAGTVGCVALAFTNADMPVATYVASHPQAVWLIGPVFAALTGLSFKEGACYGTPESVALFFAVPALLLGKLAGAPDDVEKLLLVVVALLLSVFALRKWTQPLQADIGDKSIFDFMALPPDEQQRREVELEKLERGF